MKEIPLDTVPAATAEQMREVDRAMIEDMGIDLVQMMENAGRNLAYLAQTRFGPRSVTMLIGPGGNGGGGMVAARHLANRGVSVEIVLARDAYRFGRISGQQYEALDRMGVPTSDRPEAADLIIDALIGYSLIGNPRTRAAQLIEWANGQEAPVLSLDTPSGLDVTSGEAATPCIAAAATMTLALPKTGLIGPDQVGELYLADVSVPPLVYERMGLGTVQPFEADSIVRLVSNT